MDDPSDAAEENLKPLYLKDAIYQGELSQAPYAITVASPTPYSGNGTVTSPEAPTIWFIRIWLDPREVATKR